VKKSLQITLKDSAVIQLEATVKKTSDSSLKVFELHQEISPLFLEVEHHKVNTVLHLDKMSPFVLLYFNDNLEFEGAAYSLNSYDGSFGVGTIYKKILLIHYPIDFALENVSHLTFID
jgi:hypothetical protein